MFPNMQIGIQDSRHLSFQSSTKTCLRAGFFHVKIVRAHWKNTFEFHKKIHGKQMLPVPIENLIHEYALEMGNLESLPDIQAVVELANKSNSTLILIGNRHFGVPLPVLMEIHLREDFSEPLFVDFVLTPAAINDFDEIVSICVSRNWATSSLFWLFIIREPNLYHGPYTRIFEESLLFKLLNVITSY